MAAPSPSPRAPAMSPDGPTSIPSAPCDRSTPSTQLFGRHLLAARVAWGALAGLLVGLYVLLLPACLVQLQTVCNGASCALVQPSPASAHALQQMGVSVGAYAAVTAALIVLSSLVAFAVAGVIVWRKSDDWMALLVALALVALGTELVPYLLQTGSFAWQLLVLIMNALDFAVLFLVFVLFPSGRFVPSWTPWLVVGWLVASGALIIFVLWTGVLLFTVYSLIWLVVFCGVAGAQVYRYRVVSTPRERAQTRWVVFGGVTALVVVLVDFVPAYLVPALGRSGSLYLLASAPVYALPIIVFSVCLGIAILRHRLYDIDVIIRRTVIYGLVTGTLATIYAISGLLLQAGFQAATRQGSALAVVGSTLAIAALFVPVRRRVQVIVDQRFYRRKYDAAQTVAAFGRTLGREMDLARLTDHLLGVVVETMQPSQVSLWLVRPEGPPPVGEPSAWQRMNTAEAAAARMPKPVPLPDLFVGSADPQS